MEISMRKTSGLKRLLTFVLAFAMLAAYIPFTVSAAEAETSAGTYVLEAKLLETFAAGVKQDGEEQKAGTDDYFTLIWSAKTKVESSGKKTWEDGYESAQRINFGGKASTTKNAVKFTTSAPATVKIWWVQGGEDSRQMGLLDSTGEVVTKTEGTYTKNTAYYSELKLDAAGTYYLGGIENNNNIYKVVVEEEVQVSAKAYELEAKLLETFAAGAKQDGDEQKAGTDDYFTLIWSAKTKVESSGKKTWEDGYESAQRINFGGKASTTKNAVKFTTSAPATVKIWWVQGGEDSRQMGLLDSTGEVVTETEGTYKKNDPYYSELKLDAAGTYYLGGVTNNNNIYKVVVEEQGSSPAKPPRADWETVELPVITAVVQNGDKVDVTVAANVGYDGADKLTITMYDAEGNELDSQSSTAEKTEHVKTFSPDGSGTYTFSATIIREEEDVTLEKTAAEAETIDFVLPLTAPVMKSAANNGNGSVTVEWNAVKEADSYIVTVGDQSKTVTECSATFDGLKVGMTVTFTVTAVRGDETGPESTIECEVKAEKERAWVFAAFGSSTSTNSSQNGYEVHEDGSVTVWSLGGKGKLVPGSTDGIAFYYTKLDPNTENFKLTAKVHVDEWTYSNGQEGFGLMVSDRVGAHGASASLWNNSYMAVITKVEYNWDGEKVSDSGTKYTMKLGIGSQEKINVTPENLDDPDLGGQIFKSTMRPLETSVAEAGLPPKETYNLVGNYTKPTGYIDCDPLLTDFILTIEKNNTGYFVSYTDANGKTVTEKYYDTEALSHLDPENIYVGFFASRNAKATFSDIELTVTDPETDPPAEERPVTYVTPSYGILSASIANSENYELVYQGNADGTLVIKDAAGKELYNGAVKADTKVRLNVKIARGDNKFTWTMTPDPDYKPSEYERLSSYEPVSGTHTVRYDVSSATVLYVAPNADGVGTREDPMNIYEAVTKVAPGATIILLDGTYNLESTLTIERGINGTADNMITLKADPYGKTRPVLDFGGNCAGVVLAGDYWHLFGFDVTNSANGQKGVQVSGDHNKLERLLTYRNGNTGIQISRYKGTDNWEDWPSYNLILNCSSYLNADSGYEDADGFAAKLTVADGNIFDGCISAYNADDGWDLYAKVETGSIGTVVIRNSVAFKNGYLLDENGGVINAGNGNGFKMGGESLNGGHTLINSVAFANKAKGIDSNSCPDIHVINSTSYDNESYNVAFYTNNAANTNFSATGLISYKSAAGAGENFKFTGTQDESLVRNATNYFFDGTKSVNTEGVEVEASWFVSLDTANAISGGESGITRNADGTINMNGYLELTAEAPENSGARISESNHFYDVKGDEYYADAVDFVARSGLMFGIEPNVFGPYELSNRAMVITVIWRHANMPEASGKTPFVDIESGAYYEKAVQWAYEAGIVAGIDSTHFAPYAPVTREQMVAMLYRYNAVAAAEESDALAAFEDAGAVSDYAKDAMAWAVENGIIYGMTPTELAPLGTANRAMLASVIYRYDNLING